MVAVSSTPEYKAWRSILKRCLDKSHKRYADYGGRGITICPQWRDSFAAFLADVGPRPSSRHQIDRTENNGNYEPGNVQWSTPKQQCRNRRSNRLLTFRGRTMTLIEWCEELGLRHTTLRMRLAKGWPAPRALSTPLDASKSLRPIKRPLPVPA